MEQRVWVQRESDREKTETRGPENIDSLDETARFKIAAKLREPDGLAKRMEREGPNMPKRDPKTPTRRNAERRQTQ